MAERVLRPARASNAEIVRLKSRFTCTVARCDSVDEARALIASHKGQFADASHHAYAFRIGSGANVTEGMSDDGEQSGTAGPPLLSILRGSGLADIGAVVTRYYGGTNLGTGGLVKAYGDALRAAMEILATEPKVVRQPLELQIPYPAFETVRRQFRDLDVLLVDEAFAEQVSLSLSVAEQDVDLLVTRVIEVTAGRVRIERHAFDAG